jgi:hypothetical protein
MKKVFVVPLTVLVLLIGLSSNALSISFTGLTQVTPWQGDSDFDYGNPLGQNYGSGLGNYIGTGVLSNYGDGTVDAFFLSAGFSSVQQIGINISPGPGGYAGTWDVMNGASNGDYITYLMVKGNTGFSLHEYNPAGQHGTWNTNYLGTNPKGIGYAMSFVRAYDTGGTAPVPEPATIMLLGAGLLGLAGVSRKKLLKKR